MKETSVTGKKEKVGVKIVRLAVKNLELAVLEFFVNWLDFRKMLLKIEMLNYVFILFF